MQSIKGQMRWQTQHKASTIASTVQGSTAYSSRQHMHGCRSQCRVHVTNAIRLYTAAAACFPAPSKGSVQLTFLW